MTEVNSVPQLGSLEIRNGRVSRSDDHFSRQMDKLPLEVRRLIWKYLACEIEESFIVKVNDHFDPLPGTDFCNDLTSAPVTRLLEHHPSVAHDYIMQVLARRHPIVGVKNFSEEYFEDLLRSQEFLFSVHGHDMFKDPTDRDLSLGYLYAITRLLETWIEFLEHRGQLDFPGKLGFAVTGLEATQPWPATKPKPEHCPVLEVLYMIDNFPREKLVVAVSFSSIFPKCPLFYFSLKDAEETRRFVLNQLDEMDQAFNANIAKDQNYSLVDIVSRLDEGDEYFQRNRRDIEWRKEMANCRQYIHWICDFMKDLEKPFDSDEEVSEDDEDEKAMAMATE